MIHLSAAHARRFLVLRHFLAPPRALVGTQASVMSVFERLGSLQFDPLQPAGARNHDLALHARLRDYRPALLNDLLYRDRKLFEAYNKSLNLLPVAELPWHRHAWRRAQHGRPGALLATHARLAKSVIERLRREGPLAASAFDRALKVESYWGTTTSLVRHVLDALFMTGRVGIARRDGNARTYDLIERLFEPALLARRVPKEEAIQHRLLSRHRAVGLMGERAAPELVGGLASAADRRRHLAALVERGALFPVRVEGLRDVRHVLTTEKDLIAQSASAPRRARAVTFLAPLDPLMWDRKLVRELFGFDYTWEVYTSVAKRKYGYYVLPVLFGDEIVGRIEPCFDRKGKRLHIAGLWLEPSFDPLEPAFGAAMAEALHAYARFVGATRTTFHSRRTASMSSIKSIGASPIPRQ